MVDADSQLDFDGFVAVDYSETENFAAALRSGCDGD